MTNFALEKASSTEVVAAYSTAHTVVPAVGSEVSSGWYVLGTFSPHITVKGARLEVYGMVSVEGMTLEVRLFDLSTPAVVPSLVTITSLSLVRLRGPENTLVGGRNYQMQARAISTLETPSESEFAVVSTATITD